MNFLAKIFKRKTQSDLASPLKIITTPVEGRTGVFKTQAEKANGSLTPPITILTSPKQFTYRH